jgi:ABC-type Na+ efflux pump permease subunit
MNPRQAKRLALLLKGAISIALLSWVASRADLPQLQTVLASAEIPLLVLAFAVGTVPGLLLLGTGLSAIVRRYRRPSDLIAGVLMLVMAAMLIRKALKAFG